ncbi:MAG: hypothetical protein ACRDUA_05135 [Micromonosporaceae bacterium]
MDRRATLAGMLGGAVVAGFGATGCDLLSPEPPPPHPLASTLRRSRALVAEYQAAISAHPGLARQLTPLRDNHRAHVTQLAKLIGPTASSSPSTSPGGSAPPDEAATLTGLRDAESDAEADAVRTCLRVKAEYAGLLGSIAACRATHREALA